MTLFALRILEQRKVQTFVPLEAELNKEEDRIWMMYFMQKIGTYIFFLKCAVLFGILYISCGQKHFL